MTVCERGGAYRPLDNRTIARLREMDLYRRFDGRHEKFIGRMVEEELRQRQAELDLAKKKREDQESEERLDRLRFEVAKALDRTSHPRMRMRR